MASLYPVTKIRDTNYAAATATSPRRFSAPFDGDRETYVHEQDFIQDASKFKPLQLSTPDAPDYSRSFLIEETAPMPAGPGLVQWTRVFSRIPQRRYGGESYAWTLPGIAVEASYYSKTVDNTNSFNVAGSRTRIKTTSPHDMVIGNYVQISFTTTLGNLQQTFTVNRVVLAVPGIQFIEVDVVMQDEDPFYLFVQRVDGGRDVLTKVVPSILRYDYFLPGLPGQVKTFQEIPINQALLILDSAGKETDTFSLTTNPTKAQWLDRVMARQLITPESSSVKRWRGNIWERVTRFVYAQ